MGEQETDDGRYRGELAAAIRHACGRRLEIRRMEPLGGGCIHRAACLHGAGGERLFLKRNDAAFADLFAAEADGLEALARSRTFRVPRVVATGLAGETAFLALEFIDPPAEAGDAAAFGEALAALHACTGDHFGWHRDNYIGTTPQVNEPDSDWCRFWRQRRLAPMLDEVATAGHERIADAGRRLCEVLPALLADHPPAASLLHGDLWAGNAGYDEHGRPLVFDPAVYRGDREADLAMTELFGGFAPRFRSAYEAHAPLAAGHGTRCRVYNLYHVLNHARLFGGGYAGRAQRMIAELLAEAGA